MEVEFPLEEILSLPLMAHLATASALGPRVSPVWFLWEEGAMWFAGRSSDTFPKRIRKTPECAVGAVDLDLQRGMLRHVGMRGVAEVVPLDDARLQRLLRRYLGNDPTAWSTTFRQGVIEKLDLMVRFTPASIVARDQSYFSPASPRGYPG
jgi:hypothetical protein